MQTKTLYKGLLAHVFHFAKSREVNVEYDEEVLPSNNISLEDVRKFSDILNVWFGKEEYEYYDYQIEAIYRALSQERSILLSPTASGKSSIIYGIIRWYLGTKKNVLLVVPSTSLVEQMYKDFELYSEKNGWNVDKNCQKLYSGFSNEFEKRVMITTWQSVWKLPKSWFDQFDVIIGDEAHNFKAKSLQTLFDKLGDCKYRVGTTGTLDGKQTNELTLTGMFGPVHKVITTKELMDAGMVSKLKPNCVVVKYPKAVRQAAGKLSYQDEMAWLISYEPRNKMLCDVALRCKGTTILISQYNEKHAKVLYEKLLEEAGDRPIHFIAGDVKTTDRENIRTSIDPDTDPIIVCTFGVMSTGVNMKSIRNVILGTPMKSKIKTLQTIGRGLRLDEGKNTCNLFDFADDLSNTKKPNHTLRHAHERYKIYAQEKFNMKIMEITLA